MAPTDAVEALAESPERPIIDLRATLGRGDGFARVLERAGVGAAEADQVAALIAGVVPVGDIRPGTIMDLTLGRRPEPDAWPARSTGSAFRARFDLRVEIARVDGALALTQIPIAVDETPLRIQGRVGASLYRSARAAGVPARAVESYIRALNTQVQRARRDQLRTTASTSSSSIAAPPPARSRPASCSMPASIRAERPRPAADAVDERRPQPVVRGVGRRPADAAACPAPVPGRVTSNYGLRMHPILGYSRMHRGLDFRAGYGTPILAVADGRVARAGWAGGYGQQVRLNHAGGLATSYSHMSRIAVAPGPRVRQGQVIGYVGSTGLSTGPHLHFEIYRNGATINPRSVRFVGRAQLTGAELASFRSRLRSLLGTPVGAAQAQARPDGRSATRSRALIVIPAKAGVRHFVEA